MRFLWLLSAVTGTLGYDPLQITSLQILNADGSTQYPVNPSVPVRVKLQAQNHYKTTIRSTKTAVTIYQWDNRKCAWSEMNFISTFLQNLNACALTHQCVPLETGLVSRDVTVDLSGFAWIIKLLTGSNPYRLVIHQYETDDSSNTEINCADIELLIK